jgi:5-methylcytosine-specific restriction endonuclease McrA
VLALVSKANLNGEEEDSSTMKGAVLVLNASYEYLNVTSIRRAISLVLKKKAEVVEASDDRVIHGIGRRIKMPSVVRMLYYIRRPFKEIPLTRKNVLARDRNTCQYCGRPGDTVDHIVPRSRGGPDTWENCVCACSSCNRKKNDRSPEEQGMKLRSRPRRPSLIPWLMLGRDAHRKSWARYLFSEELA